MKTTIDNPERTLSEAIKHTRARTRRKATHTVVERFIKLERLEALNTRIRGRFKDFMTPAELRAMREEATFTAIARP